MDENEPEKSGYQEAAPKIEYDDAGQKMMWWLAGASRREKGAVPPFPISVFWVLIVAIVWIVRKWSKWLRS